MTESQGKALCKAGVYRVDRDEEYNYILVPVDGIGAVYVWKWDTMRWEEVSR